MQQLVHYLDRHLVASQNQEVKLSTVLLCYISHLFDISLSHTHRQSHVSIGTTAGDDPGHQVSKDAMWRAGCHPAGVCCHPGTVQTIWQWRAIAQLGQAALRAHARLPCSLWSGEGILLMLVMGLLGLTGLDFHRISQTTSPAKPRFWHYLWAH